MNWHTSVVGRRLAAALAPRSRPVLVLSLPRSGSSWVADVLAAAPRVLYLREPFTQTLLADDQYEGPAFADVDAVGVPAAYRSALLDVAGAVPSFVGTVVADPGRWSLLARRSSRLLVKEVNPLAIEWFVDELDPVVVYLVRHPAAVAASFARLGWAAVLEQRLGEHRAMAITSGVERGWWEDMGTLQGFLLSTSLSELAGRLDVHVVRYEDLCEGPDGFERLFAALGLSWNRSVADHVQRRSETRGDRDRPYTVDRVSLDMISAWRDEVSPSDLAALRGAFMAQSPHWYTADAEW